MKKLVMFFAVIAATMMTQAATLDWGAGVLSDNGGPHDDLGGYATPGVNLYLIYNGIGGSFVATNFYYDIPSASLSYTTGLGVNTIVASYVNTLADYDATGGFGQTLTGIGLTWLGETSATWEAMNNRSFTMVAISDADGNFESGANWNYITLNASGFTTALGADSMGNVARVSFDASGAGALTVIPEPATFGLMALGGIGTWLLRRNKLKSKEEAEG